MEPANGQLRVGGLRSASPMSVQLVLYMALYQYYCRCVCGECIFGENKRLLIDDRQHYMKPGITAAQILRARGYEAQEFSYVSSDKYIMSITRGRNPLLETRSSPSTEANKSQRLPILMLHGSILSAGSFLANSEGVRPRLHDTDSRPLDSFTLAELERHPIGQDPAARTLPFIAMNLGHEVWLLDRRGFGQSRGIEGRPKRTLVDALLAAPRTFLESLITGFSLTGYGEPGPPPERVPPPPLPDSTDNTHSQQQGTNSSSSSDSHRTSLLRELARQLRSLLLLPNSFDSLRSMADDFIDTFDPEYWQFSIDEQAEIDFPEAIDFVLQQSGAHKLHTVGLSCGGAIILMGLAARPEYASKISRASLWAPSVNLGSPEDIDFLVSTILLSTLQGYEGPAPFLFQQDQIETILQTLCATETAQHTICQSVVALIAGPSGDQQPLRPWLLANLLRSTGPRELKQLGQMAHTQVPCKFSLNTDEKNQLKYGQPRPPCYDFGRIELLNISAYVGASDRLVSPSDVATSFHQMRVPTELHVIRGAGLSFNHAGALNHEQSARLVILPTLLDMARSEQSISL